MDPAIEERLRKGATALGNTWRAGQRCGTGWGVTISDFPDGETSEKAVERWACQCTPRTDFCKAKALWFRLAMIELRDLVEGEYGVPMMMTATEWDLTKLTMKVEYEKLGQVVIGPGGTLTMSDLKKHMKAPQDLQATLLVLKTFPGARVEGIEEGQATSKIDSPGTVDTEPVPSEVSDAPGEEVT